MSFCVQCGLRIPDGAKVCPKCQPGSVQQDECPRCHQPYGSSQAKFCINCGQPRTLPQEPPVEMEKSGPPQKGSAGSRQCPKCGRENKLAAAKFCIYCSARLPEPQAPDSPDPGQATSLPEALKQPEPLDAARKDLVDRIADNRKAACRKIGRLVLAAYREGSLPKDSLPQSLAAEVETALTFIEKGHQEMALAGVCPRCQDTLIDKDSRQCTRCGLTVSL